MSSMDKPTSMITKRRRHPMRCWLLAAAGAAALGVSALPARADVAGLARGFFEGGFHSEITSLFSRSTLEDIGYGAMAFKRQVEAIGVPIDPAELAQRYREFSPHQYRDLYRVARVAGSRGDAKALRTLAVMFSRGLGVGRSLVMTYALQYLIEQADPSGRLEASLTRGELRKVMSGDAVEAADILAGQLQHAFLPTMDRHVAPM